MMMMRNETKTCQWNAFFPSIIFIFFFSNGAPRANGEEAKKDTKKMRQHENRIWHFETGTGGGGWSDGPYIVSKW